ncbi:Rne/Rng family ribonuclease, partial [bacterium]|nr:Rne/Rng family ribonuclease [bacterium]
MITNFFKDLTKHTDETDLKNRIIINVDQQETRIAFMINHKLENFFIERNSNRPAAGNIYIGIVKDIIPSIQAAFIDIGEEKNGFIHVADVKENFSALFDRLVDENPAQVNKKNHQNISITDVLRKGQVIPVQVRKEELGSKGARLTSNITLPGRNLVLIPYANRRGISRKIIDREERARLKELLKSIKIPGDYGVIVRTAGGNATVKNLQMDINFLVRTWRGLQKTVEGYQGKPFCVHNDSDIAITILRDMDIDHIDEIVVDCRETYLKIKKYFRFFFPNSRRKVVYHRKKIAVFDYYSVEEELAKIFQRKVWLKCGGYIVIDEAEALIAIDVNSGRNVQNKNLEKTIMQTNLEAAEEIARQLRL